MRRFTILIENEQGQSGIIIVGALIALLALLSLIVDAGYAYAQRRQMQNAVDAGAQAGSVALGLHKRNGEVDAAIREYVQRNGVDPNRITWHWVTEDANRNRVVDTNDPILAYGGSNNFPPRNIPEIGGPPVVGVQVDGDKTFSTFFAGIVGWRQMQVGAGSNSFTNKGACSASNLFPLAISETTFDDTDSDGLREVKFEDEYPTYTYPIVETTGADRRFVFVSWDANTSRAQLQNNMNGTDALNSPSGTWGVGESMLRVNQSLSSMNTEMQRHLNQSRTVPVYDVRASTSTSFQIIAFARIKIVSVNTGTGRIDAKFEHYVDSSAPGGCANYGVPPSGPPPADLPRSLVGTIKIRKLNMTNTHATQVHTSVDVVNVLDISGSMNDGFGGTPKIAAARNALIDFNSNMQPLLGDKVALVTFPTIPSGRKYSFNCQQSGQTTNYYFGEVLHNLTNNITQVNNTISNLRANGGTPIADGMRLGRTTVLGAGHSGTSVPVVILASDGMANIRLNGKWTGFEGSTYENLPCNQPAVQDALDQANITKSDNNADGKPDAIVFTIAIGDDFNPAALQAMATQDTDPSKPHYFRVTDAASMASIYQQIASRVQQIGDENCNVIETTQFAPNAHLTLRLGSNGQTFNVTTTSTGEFVMTDIEPGTYTVTSGTVTVDGLTYSIFTDGLGGPPLPQSPRITVGEASTTYKTELYLDTGDSISCGN